MSSTLCFRAGEGYSYAAGPAAFVVSIPDFTQALSPMADEPCTACTPAGSPALNARAASSAKLTASLRKGKKKKKLKKVKFSFEVSTS